MNSLDGIEYQIHYIDNFATAFLRDDLSFYSKIAINAWKTISGGHNLELQQLIY
jgi:hypothetical protein